MIESGFDLEAYCGRIGYSGALLPTVFVLRDICSRQAAAIPFENLDPLLGRPLGLDTPSLQAKLVAKRRGGYCFELNPLLQAALTAIGFDARALAARVMLNAAPGTLAPRTHALLRVTVDGRDWIADVGFGRLTPTVPLRLEPGLVQETPHEAYCIDAAGPEYNLHARVGGQWQLLYRFHLIEHGLIDHIVHNHFVATHPSSFFRHSIVAALPVEGGRHVLFNDRLTFQHTDGRRDERVLADVTDLMAVLADLFGIEPPDEHGLAAAFCRIKRDAPEA